MADKEKKATQDSKVEKATTDESAKAAEKVAKAAKGNSKKDKPSFFARAGKGTKRFYKDFKGECKKIVWPDAKTVLKSTGIVLAVVTVITLVVWGIDTGLTAGVQGLKNLAAGDETTAVVTTTEAHDHDEEDTTKADEKDTTASADNKAETTDAEETTEAGETTEAEETITEAKDEE